MERKIAPFYLSLAGGLLLACSPEVNTPAPTLEPAPEPTPIAKLLRTPTLTPFPTPRSLPPVGSLDLETLQVLQDRYTKRYLEQEALSYLELCGVLPLTIKEEVGATGSLDWPTHGPTFGYFSQWHPGLDISPPFGTPVTAADGGLVLATAEEPWGRLGWHILLFHGEGVTVYGHLSQISVNLGDRVTKGEQIGRVGSTGRSTGPHLHFEVIQKTADGCEWVNPLDEGVLP